jgi:hypothetical protein
MALVKCKDCAEGVSTDAESCPKCGADNEGYDSPKETMAKVSAIFFSLL